MTKIRVACIVGARPNFMKIAPLLRAMEAYPEVKATLIHTGQHYDVRLSDIFFDDLEMRRPDICLEVGSGSHAVQTARVMERFERVLVDASAAGASYDLVAVVGDVNSTMAASLAAAKLGVRVAHIEAGLRSFDRNMPEEINRIVTDSITDVFLVSEPTGVDNLLKEGKPAENIHLAGNVMIDTLRSLLPKATARAAYQKFGIEPGDYGVVTLHRPANVDDRDTLASLLDVLIEAADALPLVFSIHPRTRRRIDEFGLGKLLDAADRIVQLKPLGYLDFLSLTSNARLIVTDSGGLQEESTALSIPCLTMRPNTERPVTVEYGTSTLIGDDAELLRHHLKGIMLGEYKQGCCPDLWDGHAAERIAEVLFGSAPRGAVRRADLEPDEYESPTGQSVS